MGSLTVLAGLMFTLGTRPVSALRVTHNSNLSETERALETDREKLMNKVKSRHLENNFQTKVESLDDFSKIRAVEEEVRSAEADGTVKNIFEKKLSLLEKAIKDVPSRYQKDMKAGYDYLKLMQNDSYFSNSERLKRLEDLEKCLSTPKKIRDIRWFR